MTKSLSRHDQARADCQAGPSQRTLGLLELPAIVASHPPSRARDTRTSTTPGFPPYLICSREIQVC